MAVKALVKPGEYHDSIQLMLVARALTETPGVEDAAVVMATEANKSILAAAGMLTTAVQSSGPNDLVVVVRAGAESIADVSLERAETLLRGKTAAGRAGEVRPRSLRGAVSLQPDSNVAVVSVAGRFAADEAWEALQRGLHVLLFSDHVSLEDEIALKKYARDHSLLLMGPGAGTTILNHTALGFANVVPAGTIGIVSAAGTGLQEVSSLIARLGAGISQGIGVGGRDLSREVGGMMMLEALKSLQLDPATEVIVLVSKPPAPKVAQDIPNQVVKGNKPTVVCFLGGDPGMIKGDHGVIPARTLQESALFAVQAAGIKIGDAQSLMLLEAQRLAERARSLRTKLAPGQRCLRGLFSGGTLCYEAQVVWHDLHIEPIHSNVPLPGGPALTDSTRSLGHTAVDMGEEEFTLGRLHPMMDQELRIRRLLQEAGDPEVAVIMLDVVLGYGAHAAPASELEPAIQQAKELASAAGRCLNVVVSVTGTEGDPQNLAHVVSTLERAGAIVCDSNAAAARLSGLIVSSRSEA